jgi:hypothetical protein
MSYCVVEQMHGPGSCRACDLWALMAFDQDDDLYAIEVARRSGDRTAELAAGTRYAYAEESIRLLEQLPAGDHEDDAR